MSMVDPNTGELVHIPQNIIEVAREPQEVLEEARKAAAALQDVIKTKAKPVMMNGEQYLEFEDWQTVGKFYGVTAKVVDTEYVEYGNAKGFIARAVAIRVIDGMEISGAEAMCMNDEANWKAKPLFQLRSMAQTRACAKSLRNILAWVVVLAGYKTTPAEEMTGNEGNSNQSKPAANNNQASDPQRKAIYAITKSMELTPEDVKIIMQKRYSVDSSTALTKEQANDLITYLKGKQESGDPLDEFIEIT